MINRFTLISARLQAGIIALALVFNLLLSNVVLLSNAEGSNLNLGIEITEIMYDSPINDSGGEWLEFNNGTGETIDLSGWILSVGEESETLSQREGWGDIRKIKPGAYVVITEPSSTVSFDELYGPPSASIFVAVTQTAISLSNSEGERILMQNADASQTFQDFVYPDLAKDAPLVKLSLDADEDKEQSWVSGQNPNGTPGMGEDTPLPVMFSNINAVLTEKGIKIQWVTQTEVNNLGFNILRSKTEDGPFESITPAMINGTGSSATPHQYTFLDEEADANTISFYRIESVDLFGDKQTSPIVKASSYSNIHPKRHLLATWANLKQR
ncbi:MAG: lamin tail domain-containing protein [Candidatus Poribacteria bacterium]